MNHSFEPSFKNLSNIILPSFQINFKYLVVFWIFIREDRVVIAVLETR